jgi:hypothetical protein
LDRNGNAICHFELNRHTLYLFEAVRLVVRLQKLLIIGTRSMSVRSEKIQC